MTQLILSVLCCKAQLFNVIAQKEMSLNDQKDHEKNTPQLPSAIEQKRADCVASDL